MEVNKAQWPEGTTVDLEGYYSPEGEMLNSEPHTQEFVDAWNGVVTPAESTMVGYEDAIEKAVSNILTEKSSKAEMEIEARKHGLELDRRQSKKSLWGKLKKVMK
jgi:hypothetical protein|tara:strand:+ start:499 stop:813 length:315 start_codon:yes stop_codon:yes gene_type:complete